MDQPDDDAPLYSVHSSADGWRVIGPNGLAGTYRTEREAQAKADFLNEQVAEEREDDT
jgi:hypothetical protein